MGEAEQLTIKEMLGEGTFGKVYKGKLLQASRGGFGMALRATRLLQITFYCTPAAPMLAITH